MIKTLIGQFGHPRGVAGRVVGWVMAHRSSNRRRNLWVADRLGVRPTDRILEVGFGPGVAIAELARRIGDEGHVHGVDHSEVMLRQASRRNAAAIRAGRVTLTRAAVDELPSALSGPFDVILAVNSLGHWPAPAERLGELGGRLVPGGRLAIVSQPRCPGATARTPVKAAREIQDLLEGAGLIHERTETLDLDPPVVCVLARRPAAGVG
ncbi:SAM-dependent methyltransferase [Nonomuraea thailandensis]|uniref:SAM-dependent methyltransferase n=1 Tax=Nonomuraea thailandensis TaxID=1188745 RepID=A0A9X2GP14_9ACTN|nr:methyltransferase domain-containing protein [Nonomuraea thailandensis]MCP2361235.1 SAM-dependent methyltransferase [Nonomuraea thailandensis]